MKAYSSQRRLNNKRWKRPNGGIRDREKVFRGGLKKTDAVIIEGICALL